MYDDEKSKAKLLRELKVLRHRVAELEPAKVDLKKKEELSRKKGENTSPCPSEHNFSTIGEKLVEEGCTLRSRPEELGHHKAEYKWPEETVGEHKWIRNKKMGRRRFFKQM